MPSWAYCVMGRPVEAYALVCTSRSSTIAAPPTPTPTGPRWVSATRWSGTPMEEAMSMVPGSSGSSRRSATMSSPSSSRGAGDDRVEHLLQRLAGGDGALDAREPLEQRLPLLHRQQELGVVGGMRVAALPGGALLLDDAARLQRQGEHLRDAAQQRPLLRGEGLVERAPDHQPHAAGQVAVDGQQRAQPEAVDVVHGVPADGQLGQRLDGRRPGAEPQVVHDLAVAHQRGQLALEHLGGVLDRALHDRVAVRQPGDGSQQLGELLGRPLGLRAHPTARTTSVWLWKPLVPVVRAISPYV